MSSTAFLTPASSAFLANKNPVRYAAEVFFPLPNHPSFCNSLEWAEIQDIEPIIKAGHN